MSHPGRLEFPKISATFVLFVVVFGLVFAPAVQAAPAPQGIDSSIYSLPRREANPGDVAAPTATTEHLVYNIVFDQPSPNVLGLNENLNFTFSYKTSHEGVRIWFRPITNNALSPDYAAHGSPLYAAGTGAGNGFFTIAAGDVVVDHVQIEMWTDNETALLFRAELPVHYQFRPTTNLVSNITLSPQTPNVLALDQDVNLTFSYTTNAADGVRIWARPFTSGALTPNYGAHGSPLYPVGSGSGSGSFTITSGAVVVDQIRLQMWTPDESTLLFEAFLPVHYDFREPGNLVTNIVLNPPNPNILEFEQDVTFTFDYNTTSVAGAYIWGRPISRGDTTANYAAHGSPLHPTGSGAGNGFFTIIAWPDVVDHIRFEMWNQDQTVLLFTARLPVYYQYGVPRRVFVPIILK